MRKWAQQSDTHRRSSSHLLTPLPSFCFPYHQVIKNTLNPTWKRFEIPVRTFCNGDYTRPIQINCYDWDSDGSHDTIGSCTTTLQELVSGHASFELINEKKKAKKRSYKNSGTLSVMRLGGGMGVGGCCGC